MATTEPSTPPGWVNWPTSLNRYCPNSWVEQSIDLRVRTEMSMGPPKTRRRFTSPMRMVKCTMQIEKSDVPIMRALYEGSGDSLSHTGGTEGGYKFFKYKNPNDNLFHYYRFYSPPEFTNKGPMLVNVSMEWEEL